MILAYNQTRVYDEFEEKKAFAGVNDKKKSSALPTKRRRR